MKRLLTILLASLLMVGCASNTTAKPEETAKTEGTTETTAKAAPAEK